MAYASDRRTPSRSAKHDRQTLPHRNCLAYLFERNASRLNSCPCCSKNRATAFRRPTNKQRCTRGRARASSRHIARVVRRVGEGMRIWALADTPKNKKCGEKTSPTPQADWSLDHSFKTAFGLKFLRTLFSLLSPFHVGVEPTLMPTVDSIIVPKAENAGRKFCPPAVFGSFIPPCAWQATPSAPCFGSAPSASRMARPSAAW